MIDHRIHRALSATGIALAFAYAALIAWLLLPRPEITGDGAAGPEAANTDRNGPREDRAYYRVTAPDGSRHVIEADPLDAASPLLTATERFGQGVTLERIGAAEARRSDTVAGGASSTGPTWTWLALALLLIPAWFIWLGRSIRARFSQLQRIWDALRPRLGENASALMQEAGATKPQLQAALDTINDRLSTELVWDAATGQIVDARLSHFSLVLNHCPRCNAAIHARVRADLLAAPTCSACMLPFEGQELEHQRTKIVQHLLADDPQAPKRPSAPRFSVGYFLMWALVFPPVAGIYAQRMAR